MPRRVEHGTRTIFVERRAEVRDILSTPSFRSTRIPEPIRQTYSCAVAGPTAAHRAFAHGFPIPSIVGLEELLEGVLTRYLGDYGVLTLAVEGGHAGTADAVANLAVITIALAVTGVVAPEQVAGLAEARARLEVVRGALPQTIEVVIRHEVQPDHAFQMEPGFANIHATAGGTLLAQDRSGEIRAPFDGLVLLPLYQSEGSDGFFYGRAVAAG